MLLILHAFSTYSLCGLIWFVQLVHYPLFGGVPADAFPAYEAAHVERTGWVVAPLMIAELITGLLLFNTMRIALALIVAIWVSTFFVQVPLHNQLAAAFDAGVHRNLTTTNWLRTIAWTARAVLVSRALYAKCKPDARSASDK
jgi:hypothetical protein